MGFKAKTTPQKVGELVGRIMYILETRQVLVSNLDISNGFLIC